jgi:hypothetical protein
MLFAPEYFAPVPIRVDQYRFFPVRLILLDATKLLLSGEWFIMYRSKSIKTGVSLSISVINRVAVCAKYAYIARITVLVSD